MCSATRASPRSTSASSAAAPAEARPRGSSPRPARTCSSSKPDSTRGRASARATRRRCRSTATTRSSTESRGWDDPGTLLAAADVPHGGDRRRPCRRRRQRHAADASGGGLAHADMKSPRFNEVDFQLATTFAETVAATPGLVDPRLERRRRRNAERQLRRLAVHVCGTGAVLLRGRVPLRCAGRRHRESVRVDALRQGLPDAARRSACTSTCFSSSGAQRTALHRGDGALHPHHVSRPASTRASDDNRPPCVDCGPAAAAAAPTTRRAPRR